MNAVYSNIGDKEMAKLFAGRIGMTGPLSSHVRDIRNTLSTASKIKEYHEEMRTAKTRNARRAATQRFKLKMRTAERSMVRMMSEEMGIPIKAVYDLFPDLHGAAFEAAADVLK